MLSLVTTLPLQEEGIESNAIIIDSVSTSQQSGFFANKDAKKMIIISNQMERKIVVSNNDDKLQCFTIINNIK